MWNMSSHLHCITYFILHKYLAAHGCNTPEWPLHDFWFKRKWHQSWKVASRWNQFTNFEHTSCNCNWGTCIALPTKRPRAHHRVNPYPGARRQNDTEMFSDHEETRLLIAAAVKWGTKTKEAPCGYTDVPVDS